MHTTADVQWTHSFVTASKLKKNNLISLK